ncbi:aldo/keto reductase [Colletotrichum graminicola]|uniref:Aldo/keto reductase n=1 Tax=Colletotrichum graminicola (strain M1.001 / M2 / FGSC 10212) TaxID=645133 RepID=E3QMC7_COLGM|nr:aldo/keto reductase [Colletotrichum graminicola M1.001]EFQ32015.1 aldo/keto reductase [Colletotrichum graminicola M1.001]WDK17104.1 aldo/keto reductase [Colletotrichum graminicola]
MSPPASLPVRRLGKSGPEIPALGVGLMGLSVAYGDPRSDEERLAFLDRAWELGATSWDTADCYGDNEELVGKWFALHPERRGDMFLATKFAIRSKVDDGDYRVWVDTSPRYCREACELSLKKLGVESIDLYYIHRLDDKTPVEKTIEEMVRLKSEGKIKHFGISECSSAALRRAHAVHPIAAVQVEYNPWSLEIEGAAGTDLLRTCRELGVAVFAYSPLGRGIMTGRFKSADDFDASDYRRTLPRFAGDNFRKNMELVDHFASIAKDRHRCSAGQLALAWLLAQGDDVIPIPGTKRAEYLEGNLGALKVELGEEMEKDLRALVEEADVQGDRGVAYGNYSDSPAL